MIDVTPYFGHPEVDLALVDYFSPVDPELFRAYAEIAPIDVGFAGRSRSLPATSVAGIAEQGQLTSAFFAFLRSRPIPRTACSGYYKT